jgi:hypothetical protein
MSLFDIKPCNCATYLCAEDTQCGHDGFCRRNPPLMEMLRELHERVKRLEEKQLTPNEVRAKKGLPPLDDVSTTLISGKPDKSVICASLMDVDKLECRQCHEQLQIVQMAPPYEHHWAARLNCKCADTILGAGGQ